MNKFILALIAALLIAAFSAVVVKASEEPTDEEIAYVVAYFTPAGNNTVSKVPKTALANNINFKQYSSYLKNITKKATVAQSDAETNSEAVNVAVVLNYAKQAWEFIQKNKAVSNYESHYANVLPQGINSAFDLHGWNAPVSKSFRVTNKNLLGITILDLVYTVTYIPGGQFNGKGRFLDHITILPTSVFVQWGWTFNAAVKVRSVTNAGSQSDPLASAVIELNYKLSALNSQETTESFYVRGDGGFQWLTRTNF